MHGNLLCFYHIILGQNMSYKHGLVTVCLHNITRITGLVTMNLHNITGYTKSLPSLIQPESQLFYSLKLALHNITGYTKSLRSLIQPES